MPNKKISFYTWFTVNFRMILLTILATGGTIALLWKPCNFLAWDLWTKPKVEYTINKKLEPVIEALEFQNSIMMKDMTLEEIRRLERQYKEYRRVAR